MPKKTNEKLLQAQDANELIQAVDETAGTMPEDTRPADTTPPTEEGCTLEETVIAAEPLESEEDIAALFAEEVSEVPPLADVPPPEIDAPVDQTVPFDAAADKKAKPSAKAVKSKATKAKVSKAVEPTDEDALKPRNARQSFYSLDFRALDRDLSPEQEQEWNAIYASFRSRSILTGTVIGVDDHTFDITNEQGEIQRKTVRSLIIVGYRVKVMIPETEVWAAGEESPHYTLRSTVGSKVDYVIMRVDRENECAIASRRMAMTKRRRHTLQTARNNRELVLCDTILVSRKAMLVNCGGFDLVLTQKDLRYTAIDDLRTEYKPGMELRARLLDIREGKPVVSVKEVNPNPFDGASLRHPVGSRRQAIIEGKYGGGVFCRLPDNTTCLCLYSNNHYDGAFDSGDTVLVHITEFDYNRKLIYGRIVGKQ